VDLLALRRGVSSNRSDAPPLPGPVLGFGVGLDSCTDNSFSITVKLVEDNKLILVINSKLIKKLYVTNE